MDIVAVPLGSEVGNVQEIPMPVERRLKTTAGVILLTQYRADPTFATCV